MRVTLLHAGAARTPCDGERNLSGPTVLSVGPFVANAYHSEAVAPLERLSRTKGIAAVLRDRLPWTPALG